MLTHDGGNIPWPSSIPIDTLIAATALEFDLALITTDTDSQRVPNLRVVLLER